MNKPDTKTKRQQIEEQPYCYACIDCRREVAIQEAEESGGHCGACGSANLIALGAPDSIEEHGL